MRRIRIYKLSDNSRTLDNFSFLALFYTINKLKRDVSLTKCRDFVDKNISNSSLQNLTIKNILKEIN